MHLPELMLNHATFTFFFFTAPPTTEIYTLSLHDALPICQRPDHAGRQQPVALRRQRNSSQHADPQGPRRGGSRQCHQGRRGDRKSTRLNSSHSSISYAVFCLKKKK